MYRCPHIGCGRVDGDLGQCGRGVVPCPEPVEVDPAKDVIAVCGLCEITRAIPLDSIMRGKTQDIACKGIRSDCLAVVLNGSRTVQDTGQRQPPPESSLERSQALAPQRQPIGRKTGKVKPGEPVPRNTPPGSKE